MSVCNRGHGHQMARWGVWLLLSVASVAWAGGGGRMRETLDVNKASLRDDISRFSADRGRNPSSAYPNWAAPADGRERQYDAQGHRRQQGGGAEGRGRSGRARD